VVSARNLCSYLNEDLKNKLELSYTVINKSDKKKYKISVAHAILPSSSMVSTESMGLQNIYYKILSLLPGDVMLVTLSTLIFLDMIHESGINEVISTGKIPWTSLIFES
jgi:hypothetical protein